LSPPTPKIKHRSRAPVALDLIEAEDMPGEAVARYTPIPDPVDEMDSLDEPGGPV
jgi:hypothetical protein